MSHKCGSYMNTLRCTEQDCDRPVIVPLGSSVFCTGHFIAYAYGQLQECSEQIKRREYLNDSAADRLIGVLTTIAGASVTVALESTDMNALERAQVVDILGSLTSLAEFLKEAGSPETVQRGRKDGW